MAEATKHLVRLLEKSICILSMDKGGDSVREFDSDWARVSSKAFPTWVAENVLVEEVRKVRVEAKETNDQGRDAETMDEGDI
jgi:hypothetical protein